MKQTVQSFEPKYRLATQADINWFASAQSLGIDTPHPLLPEHCSLQKGIGIGREAVVAAFNDIDTVGPHPVEVDGITYTSVVPRDVNFECMIYNELARRGLLALSPSKGRMFEELLSQHQMPEWLNELIGLDEADIHDPSVDKATPLISKLTQKDTEGNYTVGERTFQNFLEWHNYCLAQEQKAFDAQKEAYIRTFKAAVERAVKKGWLPELALERLSRLDSVAAIVDDGFNTELEDRVGYHSFDENGIELVVVGQNPIDREHIFTHEAIHVIHGRKRAGGDGVYGSHEISKLFGRQEFASRTVLEACVEHVAVALEGNSIDDLRLGKHKHPDIYPDERRLLHALCESGVETVDIRFFINALMDEPGSLSPVGQETANEKLAAQLKAAFPGRDICQEIAQLRDMVDVQHLTYNLREEAIRRKNLAGRALIGFMRALESATKSGYRHKVTRKQNKTGYSHKKQ
jgi:hypothetical protein